MPQEKKITPSHLLQIRSGWIAQDPGTVHTADKTNLPTKNQYLFLNKTSFLVIIIHSRILLTLRNPIFFLGDSLKKTNKTHAERVIGFE